MELLSFSRRVVSDSLQPHGLQHARPPCHSPSPEVCPSSCPFHRWCHLIPWCPLFLLPSMSPNIRDFSNEWSVHIRWPKYWNFSFSINPSSDYSGLISFRVVWFDIKNLIFEHWREVLVCSWIMSCDVINSDLLQPYSFFLSFGCPLNLMRSHFTDQGSNPAPLQQKLGVLTTGPPGKSPYSLILHGYVEGQNEGQQKLCEMQNGETERVTSSYFQYFLQLHEPEFPFVA